MAVRRCVAFHPQAVDDILNALAEDSSLSVREAVATNEHTPPVTLLKMTKRIASDITALASTFSAQ